MSGREIDLRGYEASLGNFGGGTLDTAVMLLPESEKATAILESWLAPETSPDESLPITLNDPLVATPPAQDSEVAAEKSVHDEGWILSRLHRQGFVDRTQSLSEMVEDDSRTAQFEYDGQSSYAKVPDRGKWLLRMREADGLRDIHQFFGKVIDLAFNEDGTINRDRKRSLQRIGPKMASMQENLTFVGEQEFMVGAMGIASFWRSFLEADSDRQIMLAANPSTETGRARVLPKSDTFVTDHVLGLLRAQDDGSLSDRVVRSMKHLTADPEDALVVVGDDWLVTGTQMEGRISTLLDKPKMREYRDSMEVHVLAAPEDVIRNGFARGRAASRPVKVRAYYAAHGAPDAGNPGNCHTTGRHSAVGFGFATDVEKAVDAIKSVVGRKLPLPPLASIYRPYWPKGSLNRSPQQGNARYMFPSGS